jgi:hypothetical protein
MLAASQIYTRETNGMVAAHPLKQGDLSEIFCRSWEELEMEDLSVDLIRRQTSDAVMNSAMSHS